MIPNDPHLKPDIDFSDTSPKRGKPPKNDVPIYIYVFIAVIISLCIGVPMGLMPVTSNPIFTIGLLPMPENTYPSIMTYNATCTNCIPVNHTYRFQSNIIAFEITPSHSIYNEARKPESKKSFVYRGRESEENSSIKYYQAFANDPSQDELISDLHATFQKIKSAYKLSDDEYVELVSLYVQTLTYHSEGDPKYPIETVVEGRGDCDDKSLLLGSILAEDGYDVALLYFEEESHMGLGIKSDEVYAYPKADHYAFIETTGLFYVTEIPPTSKGTEPIIIPIGEGDKGYYAGEEVAAILQVKEKARDDADRIRNVSSYSDLLEYNKAAGMYNTIVSGVHDRKGVYQKVEEYLLQ